MGDIDLLTVPEANEFVNGWDEDPPVYRSLQGLIEGLSGSHHRRPLEDADIDKIRSEIGHRVPVVRKDPGLPKAKPVMDVEEMRRRNATAIINRMRKVKGQGPGEAHGR